MEPRRAVAASAGMIAGAGALLGVQAGFAVRRTDLPRVGGVDASGLEGPGDAPRVRLAALGDSTLTGPGLSDGRAVWIRMVARSLAAAVGVQVEVRSFAAEGARVGDVLSAQLAPAIRWKPDLVVTAVGTNDAVHHTPLGRVERSFERLVGALGESVAAVVIGGVGDLGSIARVPFPLTVPLAVRGRRVDRRIRAVVARHGVHYIDVSSVDAAFHRGGRALYGADLFHPNELGHALWAQAATPVVRCAASTVVPR